MDIMAAVAVAVALALALALAALAAAITFPTDMRDMDTDMGTDTTHGRHCRANRASSMSLRTRVGAETETSGRMGWTCLKGWGGAV